MVRKNRSKRTIAVVAGSVVLIAAGALYSAEFDDPLDPSTELKVEHAECVFFGPDHDKFVKQGAGTTAAGAPRTVSDRWALNSITEQVAAALPTPPGGTRTGDLTAPSTNTIDRYLFQAMDDAGVAPAPPTTDYEFIRRVTLDLTGRIPTPDAVTAFVNDSTPDKRSKYVDTLLASSQWVDKWTMYFGDFLKNNSSNTQIQRFPEGVQGFKTYIKNSLAANKPYDQMTREMIAAQGTNSYTQGELNWLIGGVVTGGPQQDLWDQQTANIAESFLGIAHVNCLLCHNGRGHLDSLSLWASQTTRYQAWGLSSFMSRTNFPRTSTGVQNRYYWGVVTDTTRFKTDYPLNTTTGNRPSRQPSGTQTTIPPQYLFTGQTPAKGTDYRTSLGQFVTSDFQFARASVNYMWAYFFGMGIVDPPNQFDPARLDPDNPPTAPWPTDPTQPWPLQPSNPQLLNALAKDFIASNYDLKALMREITTSRAYQLSARYNGTWNASWQTLFARKMVRRLWSEELHDAITQSSNIIPTYNNAIYGSTNLAMQLAEPLGTPDGNNGAVNNFLNAFLRGNRDDQPRSGDGSISQALDLMNDPFVMNRIQFSKVPNTSLLTKVAGMPNDQLVNTLFLTVLSRNPTSAEMSAALGNLGASGSTRNQEIENLLWSLYNKVDFTFNY
jgi:hypothetical protein